MDKSREALESIVIELPGSGLFARELLAFLTPLGSRTGSTIVFPASGGDSSPQLTLAFSEEALPVAMFRTASNEIRVEIQNTSGLNRTSPHEYSPLALGVVTNRLSDIRLGQLDHIGFNLPWFGDGLHQSLVDLRRQLKDVSAYHTAFTGDDWDFILPATIDEATKSVALDYSIERRPKFEIVSMNKVSTPIVQIDFSVVAPFERLAELFPEAIIEKDLGKVWVYLDNDCGVDMCLVMEQHQPGDWSHLFEGYRL